MTFSDSVLVVVLVLLVVLLALIPVLIVRMRRAARKTPPPPTQPAPAAQPERAGVRMQISPEEREGQAGGALMQDYSALQSEYRPMDAQKDALPAPRKNGKH